MKCRVRTDWSIAQQNRCLYVVEPGFRPTVIKQELHLTVEAMSFVRAVFQTREEAAEMFMKKMLKDEKNLHNLVKWQDPQLQKCLY